MASSRTRSERAAVSSSTRSSVLSSEPPSSPRIVDTSAPVSWRTTSRSTESSSSVRASHLWIRSYEAESRSKSIVIPLLPVSEGLNEIHADVGGNAEARELDDRADEVALRSLCRRGAHRRRRSATAAEQLVPGVGALTVVERLVVGRAGRSREPAGAVSK